MQDELARSLAGVLEACLQKGMSLPFHVAVVGLNGSAIVARYTQGRDNLDCEVLAEHLQDGAFRVPVNMMIVDRMGEAARVTIGNDGGFTVH